MGLFSRLFARSRASTDDDAPIGARTPALDDTARLPWRAETAMPIPDWQRAVGPDDDASDDVLHAFWSSAARTWLDALASSLASRGAYEIAESPHFLMLAALPRRGQRLVLHAAESIRKRVLDVLVDVAADDGFGKTIILVLDSPQTYYEYVSHYYSDADAAERGELALSGGMFVDAGYGHFVFVADDDMRGIDPTIAHELTHAMVRHLPLPAWLNEGIAVNVERRFFPQHNPMHTVSDLHQMHRELWNADTIQEFWSGKSWLRADDGNMLSYELATTFVSLAARDWPAFSAFVNAATHEDAGDAAARAHLGHPIAHFVDSVLGPGAWDPDPARWSEGVERGQFAPAPLRQP